MAIVQIVSQIPKIVKLIRRLDQKYRYLDPTNKFIRKNFPPQWRQRAFRLKRYGDIAITGGVIYEGLTSGGNGKVRQTRYPFRKKRSYMEQSRSKRFYRTGRKNIRRRCVCRRQPRF